MVPDGSAASLLATTLEYDIEAALGNRTLAERP
jgi:hypothetical protein